MVRVHKQPQDSKQALHVHLAALPPSTLPSCITFITQASKDFKDTKEAVEKNNTEFRKLLEMGNGSGGSDGGGGGGGAKAGVIGPAVGVPVGIVLLLAVSAVIWWMVVKRKGGVVKPGDEVKGPKAQRAVSEVHVPMGPTRREAWHGA